MDGMKKELEETITNLQKNVVKNIVTVPTSKKDLPIGTLKSISKQSGVIFK